MQRMTKEDERLVNWVMEITDVKKHENKAVSKLWGGQRQRVWIAMTLAQNTKLLLLDEPTTYLDIKYQVQILKLVRRLNTEFGITIMMVLHDISQAIHYSDEILCLKDGRIVEQGVPEQIVTPDLIEEIYRIRLKVAQDRDIRFVLKFRKLDQLRVCDGKDSNDLDSRL